MKQDLKIYKNIAKKLKNLLSYGIANSCLSDIVDNTGIGRFEEHRELTVKLCNISLPFRGQVTEPTTIATLLVTLLKYGFSVASQKACR